MRLTRLTVRNFHNLGDVDILLNGDAVIVGENRSGKSNLLHAVRLVLDPSLSSVQRALAAEDFSDSLSPDPMGNRAAISISVEFEEFEDDAGLLAALHNTLVAGAPMARPADIPFPTSRDADGQLRRPGLRMVNLWW